jgi:hypothetical protein
MKAIAKLAALTVLVTGVSGRVHACSTVACLNNGVEMRNDFIVSVTHDEKPLARVRVEIRANTQDEPRVWFRSLTDESGTVSITNLAPGNYWISTDLLGISAGEQCFHVRERPKHPQVRLAYEWGEMAIGVRQIKGVLTGLQPGTGANRIQNSLHGVRVPLPGIGLRLQNPLTGETYSVTSNDMGAFAFESAPAGTYVLHVEGGTKLGDSTLESTDLLINLSPAAKLDALPLITSNTCGGIYFELENQKVRS